jgi:hypothetical protein
MSHWIVDGMNVIGSRPDGWWRDRTGAMRALAGDLARWVAGGDERVTLVLDGRERDLGEHPGVEIRWAPVADDLIAELVAGEPDACVATSDRGLIARLGGAHVEGAKAFRERLD